MSGIQYSSLSDEEFERAVYMATSTAGTLPTEVAEELAKRNTKGLRDWDHLHNQINPKQLPLPFNK